MSGKCTAVQCPCVCTAWNPQRYLHHHVLHVVVLLRVQEGGELVSRGDAVAVPVGRLEAPLVPLQHGPVGCLVLHVVKLLTWPTRHTHARLIT